MNEFALTSIKGIDEVQNLHPLGPLRHIPAIVDNQEEYVHKSAF
jgi:hypothetical protein